LGDPAELFPRLGRVTDEEVNLRGSVEARVHPGYYIPGSDVASDLLLIAAGKFDFDSSSLEGHLDKLPNGFSPVRSQHISVRLVRLEHSPHAFDIFLGKSPIPLRIEVAER